MELSSQRAQEANEFWVVGSTLEVFPAASLVPIAARAGVPITIMNMGATQYDYLADRLIREPIEQALPQLVEKTLKERAGD